MAPAEVLGERSTVANPLTLAQAHPAAPPPASMTISPCLRWRHPATAALGLLAALVPLALGPTQAAELNLTDVKRYSGPIEAREQVTSLSQFSDLQPSSWAYQALSSLVERYGCVAGYPNGTFKGAQP